MSEKHAERRPVARHGQLRSPRPVAQLMKILGIVLAVVLVSGAGVATAVAYDMTRNFTASSVDLQGGEDLPPNLAAYEGGFNVLLVGLDVCEDEYAHLIGPRCTDGRVRSTLNDVNILVHVSEEPRKVTAISFPRDMMMPIPACTDDEGRTYSAMSKQPLNSAWHYGGLGCVALAVSELVDQDIEFAAALTFGGVIEITNAIGGVEVCLESGIRDSKTNLDMEAGTHTISGVDALQFLRTRQGVGDGSDLGRIGNQQVYMSSLVRKVVSEEVLTNPRTLLHLTRTALDNITPSTSLTNPILAGQLALVMKDVPFKDIVFVQYPTVDDPDNPGVRVVPDYSAAQTLWDALAENKSLTVTHTTGSNDGVVIGGGEDETGEEPTEEPSQEPVEATPDPDSVELPSSIRGNSVEQRACSNGNVRG